jgi:hypothetical protein
MSDLPCASVSPTTLIRRLPEGEPMKVRRLAGQWLKVDLGFSAPDRDARDADRKDPSQ